MYKKFSAVSYGNLAFLKIKSLFDSDRVFFYSSFLTYNLFLNPQLIISVCSCVLCTTNWFLGENVFFLFGLCDKSHMNNIFNINNNMQVRQSKEWSRWQERVLNGLKRVEPGKIIYHNLNDV